MMLQTWNDHHTMLVDINGRILISLVDYIKRELHDEISRGFRVSTQHLWQHLCGQLVTLCVTTGMGDNSFPDSVNHTASVIHIA
jgi:hypothetical protein